MSDRIAFSHVVGIVRPQHDLPDAEQIHQRLKLLRREHDRIEVDLFRLVLGGCGRSPCASLRHILPGTLPSVIVYVSLRVGTSILTAAALNFIGLGAPPPSPAWRAMLSEGRSYLGVADQITLCPGIAIFVTVLAFNLLGDGLRDALDQKLR